MLQSPRANLLVTVMGLRQNHRTRERERERSRSVAACTLDTVRTHQQTPRNAPLSVEQRRGCQADVVLPEGNQVVPVKAWLVPGIAPERHPEDGLRMDVRRHGDAPGGGLSLALREVPVEVPPPLQ